MSLACNWHWSYTGENGLFKERLLMCRAYASPKRIISLRIIIDIIKEKLAFFRANVPGNVAEKYYYRIYL